MTPLPPTEPRDEAPQLYSAFARRFTQPPGKLYLLHGEESVFQLSHTIASAALHRGMRIAVADGGNWFNVHTLINFARATQQNPDEVLRRVFVSRSFTCYQMEQTVAHLLPAFLKSIHSNAALIFGLLDTLYDEQAPLREVQQILRRILSALQAMKADGVSVLVTCLNRSVIPQERNQLFAILNSTVDQVYRLQLDESQRPLLLYEQRPHPLTAQPPDESNHQPRVYTNPSIPLLSQTQGDDSHGTNRADVHQHHRRRARKLVQVPPRSSPRRSGRI